MKPPHYYEIRLKGQLEACWSLWFEELQVLPQEDGNTLLCGPLPDQAALHGVLGKIRDLGLTLLSLRQVEL